MTPEDAVEVLAADARFSSLVPALRSCLAPVAPPAASPPEVPNAHPTPSIAGLVTASTPSTVRPITVYTDGACSGNPGRGGWGVHVPGGPEYSGAEAHTTNNRMELTAACVALERAPPGAAVLLLTDSTYVAKGVTDWLPGWKRNGWQTAGKQPVKNRELWQRLDGLLHEGTRENIRVQHVKAHAGIPGNERADALAVQAMNSAR
jgi:ribonuclease HI